MRSIESNSEIFFSRVRSILESDNRVMVSFGLRLGLGRDLGLGLGLGMG